MNNYDLDNKAPWYSARNSIDVIVIGKGATTIGERAFCDCLILKYVDIPESVTHLESWAFKACQSLTTVTIPNSVIKIGYNPFDKCTRLKTINYRADLNVEYEHELTYGNNAKLIPYKKISPPQRPPMPRSPMDGGKCGQNLSWTFINGKLTISGTGDMENYGRKEKIPWYAIRSSIEKLLLVMASQRLSTTLLWIART